MFPSIRLDAPGMGSSCWRHVQLPWGGLAGWGQDLPGWIEMSIKKCSKHIITRVVCHPAALLVLLFATLRIEAARRPVLHPVTFVSAPAEHPGWQICWCNSWRKELLAVGPYKSKRLKEYKDTRIQECKSERVQVYKSEKRPTWALDTQIQREKGPIQTEPLHN